MDDHVAVLRVLQELGEITPQEHAAITHAIATCEQHAALADSHANLLARLGELEVEWRKRSHDAKFCAIDFDESLRCADDLARVVKESGND